MTPTATAPTPASTAAGNAARLGPGARRRARPDQRHRPRRLGLGLQGLRHRRAASDSDSAAAVGQAILDGVDVINFSISGGTDPFTDPDRAGVPRRLRRRRVRRRLGRQRRPGCRHRQPPVAVGHHGRRVDADARVPVDADPDRRRRRHVRRSTGASITAGVDAALPVVLSSAPPYSDAAVRRAGARRARSPARSSPASAASTPASRRASTSCQGGAAGMILYNPALADIETDNHWLPTVHLADGTDFVAFMGAHTGVTGSFTAGAKADGAGRRDGRVLVRGARPAASSSPTSPRRACRSSPATRRPRRASLEGPAGRVLPGDRRHVDVVAAHRRRGGPARGAAPDVDARARSSRR